MSETCCIEGCVPAKEDVTYFKFPNSRTQRRRWLDAISVSVKVSVHTSLCSQHFLPDQYEEVRGKKRLKAKVVPSVFASITNPKSPKIDKTDFNDSEAHLATKLLQDDKSKSTPHAQSTDLEHTGEERTDTERTGVEHMDTEHTGAEHMEPELADTGQAGAEQTNTERTDAECADSQQSRLSPDQRPDSECSLRNDKEDDIVRRRQPDNISLTDSESNKDIEDIITHYQIKQVRPLQPPVAEPAPGLPPQAPLEFEVPVLLGEGEIGRSVDAGSVIDVEDEAEPVFIEVSVGKSGKVEETANQDCMMLLESVQCEVDPSSLMFPPEDVDPGNDSDIVDLGEKKEDPVSLLTSSDEDEVIIEEPKYDMVEVSDETDEDDVPLVKLVDKPAPQAAAPPRRKNNLKQLCEGDVFTKLLWGQLQEYFCMECHYSTTNRAEYNRHVEEHNTFIQVCEVCSYTTSSKHLYIRHKRKHRHERRYQCHLCKYKARHNMSLVYHLKSHDKTRGADTLARGERDSREKRLSRDKRDKRVSRDKRFACDQCEYETERRCDLTRHTARRHRAPRDDDDDYVPPRSAKAV